MGILIKLAPKPIQNKKEEGGVQQGKQLQKMCPRCGTTTVIDAAYCPTCRHQYRTQFANRTQAVPIPARQRPAWEPVQLFTLVALALISCCCIAYISQTFRAQSNAPVVTSAARQMQQR
jgi:hypothetical protein